MKIFGFFGDFSALVCALVIIGHSTMIKVLLLVLLGCNLASFHDHPLGGKIGK